VQDFAQLICYLHDEEYENLVKLFRGDDGISVEGFDHLYF
jgi:hypothetical protein